MRLLQSLELLLQVGLVRRLAEGVVGDGADDLLAERVLVPQLVPVVKKSSVSAAVRVISAGWCPPRPVTYMVSSTFSGVSLPWICFMASAARSMAASVSRLMLADSMALICCSSVPICAVVCPRLCSWAFLRFRAARAAIGGRSRQHSYGERPREAG